MQLSNKNYMQISALAEKLGITTRTIRLYEQMRLVNPPKRTEGKIRYYEKEDIARFKFILKLKALGLSLEDVKELAELYNSEHEVPERIMPRLMQMLNDHLNNIMQKVTALQSLEKDIIAFKLRICR